MPKFVLTYRTPIGYRPGGPDVMAAWTEWFQNIQGDLVDFGNPVFERTTLGKTGDNTNLGGYSIVSADDVKAATAIARTCPALNEEGGVEIGLLTELDRS